MNTMNTIFRKILGEITRVANRHGLLSVIEWKKAGTTGTVYIGLPEKDLAFDFDLSAPDYFITLRGRQKKLPGLSMNFGHPSELKAFLSRIESVIQNPPA